MRSKNYRNKFTYITEILAFVLFFAILTYNTYIFYTRYIKPCGLSPPCLLLVFSASQSWKGYEFIGYCADYLMLKTEEVYIKDCNMQTEHSLVINIMMVVGLLYIIYAGYKGFKIAFIRK